jgi:hypothetical protein
MTHVGMSIDGADTVSNNLSRARTEIPDELAQAGREGITLVHRAAGSYPSYAGKGKSERTGIYGKTQTSGVYRQGRDVVAYHNSPAKHSIWVRGDGLKYPGAWMHVGVAVPHQHPCRESAQDSNHRRYSPATCNEPSARLGGKL